MTCSWCRSVVSAATGSCPKCGATLDAKLVSDAEGWAQLPGRKDMAKLQFGNSFCQIEGLYVPVADMNLAPGDSTFTFHITSFLLARDPHVLASPSCPSPGPRKRMFAGMPLVMTQAQGPGHIAFSHDTPGELVALPMQPGQSIDVREHLFLTATSNVAYDWFSTNVQFPAYSKGSGDRPETRPNHHIGMFMDRFHTRRNPPACSSSTPPAASLSKDLGPYDAILVKPTALVFKDPTVQMQLHFEHPHSNISVGFWGRWTQRYLWLRLTGPGRVAISSVFHHIEGEALTMTNFSYATEQRW